MATVTMTRLFIGGAWEDARSGATSEATSPATGEGIGEVAQGDREDARRAVEAARDAFPGWAAATAFERAAALRRIADACERRRDELARALTLDQGKPLYAEAYDEVDELVAMWRGAAEDGIRIEGAIPPSVTPGTRVLLMRRPKGPVAIVTPWNWPYTMPAELVAPALASGNTVVWNPAPSTAVCSGPARRVRRRGRPAAPACSTSSPARGPVVGDEIVSHPHVAAVGFIGSTATGNRIAQRAAGKSLLLEMGGNGPLVVLDDADLDAAADAAIVACFLCAGQSCTAGERLLVHEASPRGLRRAPGRARRRELAARRPARRGDADGPAQQRGRRRRRWTRTSRDAVAARRPVGDRAASARTASRPTCTGRPRPRPRAGRRHAAAEETFGPIAPVVSIGSLDEAIELTNASPYGLLAAIFTADLRKGLRFADEVRAGLVNINETTNYWENHLPFGGRAGTDSGSGRVGGRYPFELLTELQTVVIGPA